MNRRAFLRLGGVAAAGLGLAATPTPVVATGEAPIDFHVHLFGIGDGGTGCRLSSTQRRHPNYRYLLRLLDLSENGRMDEDYVARLVTQLRSSSLRRCVLQAWDGRYDQQGRPDWERTTSLYVPNDYLLRVVQAHPDLFVPCASINPRRADWLDELDRCSERGVRVVKLHPPTMDVDPAEARYRPFYRRCAESGVIVMVHTGTEHSAEIVGQEVCDPRRLATALEEGCTVIAGHAGFGAFFDPEDFFPHFVAMARRFGRLYCDTAVLASMFRWRTLPRLLEAPDIVARAVHGSDFPFPSNALVFWNRLPAAMLVRLLSERNLLERDYQIKRALGLPPEVFTRGDRVLAGAGEQGSSR